MFTPPPHGIEPQVSVIVPVFNAEAYLQDCLNSLIAQTLNEIEIICVNDGSTDRSLEILTAFGDKYPKIRIFNQPNAGPGMARNKALDYAKGKYILFCDADDTLEPDAARVCSLIMEKNASDFMVFNTKITEVNRREDAKKNSAGEYITLVNAQNSGVLNKSGCMKIALLGNVWGYAFRLDMINRYKLRFTRYTYGEDGIFLLSYLLAINTGYAENEVLYNYYARQGSLATVDTKHPWFRRLAQLPRLFGHTLWFALKNRMPHNEIYVFYWLFSWLKSRRDKSMQPHKDNVSFSQKGLRIAEKSAKKIVDVLGIGNSQAFMYLVKIKAFLKKIIRPTAIDSIDICVAEHCNLGCYSCNHFSQLAEPEFADFSSTERDLQRMAELSGGNIPTIYLVGGEPLLNPQLPDFMRIARNYFPKSRVQIVTNGLLLLAQKDIFWESVKKYNITMTPTKYPGVNWEKIEKRAQEFGYKFAYFDFSGNTEKTSRKFCLDLSGNQNAKKSFKQCCMAACAVALQNGRIATCSFVFNMRHFNRYFAKNIPVTSDDSIDIYKVRTMQEIVDFINSPIPLCRFCKSMGEEIVGGWRKTEKSIEEWT